MNYISLCDGIGAAHVAWKPLGWNCIGVSEINPFCNRVVEHHFGFENLGSLSETETIEKIRAKKPSLIIGGTPCQSFSTAGKREGLDVDNGRIILWFLQAVYRAKPKYFVWENVFGAFSIDKGAVLRAFVASLAECGYMVEWRTLDAQFFGVPQRRRRIFVVGHLGDGSGREIFPESESVPWNPSACGRKGKAGHGDVANCLRARGNHSHRLDNDNVICDTVTRKRAKGSGGPSGDECQNLVVIPISEYATRLGVASMDKRCGTGIGSIGDPSFTLRSGNVNSIGIVAETLTKNWCHSNGAKAGNNAGVVNPIITQSGVRKLIPIECERLQGFPRNYTLVPIKTFKNGKVKWSSDTQRYEAIGNSMCTNVIKWIGERIKEHYERIGHRKLPDTNHVEL